MLELQIKEYAYQIGIDLIGFTNAESFIDLETRLIERENKGYLSGFEEQDIQKRCNPKLILPSAKSIIAIGIAYQVSKEQFSKTEIGLKGSLARTAWGTDYHILLKEKMTMLVEKLKEWVPQLEYVIQTDTGPLVDREVARRAGLGDYGKNNMLINPKYGSYIYLGNILVNIELLPDTPISIDCKECNLCIQACPPSALAESYQMNAKRCLSYHTQSKESIPLDIRSKMGNRIYGCDQCQQVCPFNKKADILNRPECFPSHVSHQPNLEWILNLSNKEFKNTFGKTSAGWRGKKVIQRNAVIALGNSSDVKAIPLLEKSMNDDREEIREAAAWALQEIQKHINGGKDGLLEK